MERVRVKKETVMSRLFPGIHFDLVCTKGRYVPRLGRHPVCLGENRRALEYSTKEVTGSEL